jgi:hypothetical protein
MKENRSLPMLARVRVASPCSMRWEEMEGDERTRYCRACRLHVHNLSALSGAEAEALVSRTLVKGERLCGVYYQRADGSVMTRDCPVGLAAVKARVRRRVARLAAAMGLVATGGVLGARVSAGDVSPRLRGLRPFSILAEWLGPSAPPLPPPGVMVMGEVVCPTAPPAPPAPPAP